MRRKLMHYGGNVSLMVGLCHLKEHKWKRVQQRSEHPFKSALTCWDDSRPPFYGAFKRTLKHEKTKNYEEEGLASYNNYRTLFTSY